MADLDPERSKTHRLTFPINIRSTDSKTEEL